jgi:hypothetical protein
MKLHIPTIALLMFTATSALAQSGSATVTGAIDTNKNRTSATEAKEGTKAGNRQAVMPANAGNEAAQQQPTKPNQPKTPEDSKPH